MVCAEIRLNGTSHTRSAAPVATRVNPFEQVPRKPSVFHSEIGVVEIRSRSHSTITWSLAGLSAWRRAVARMTSEYSP